MTAKKPVPQWIVLTLTLAGAYNLAWGAWAIFFPNMPFELLGVAPPAYPQLWQCIGMMVGVYGVGYLVAARDPMRHWPIVLVGFLGKVFGPVGYVWGAAEGDLPWLGFVTIVFNDLIWWWPFGAILYYAYRENTKPAADCGADRPDRERLVGELRSQGGATLAELSRGRPLLVVFLRHQGCAFCREALADLSRARPKLEEKGVGLALVHMSENEDIEPLLARYDMADVDHFSDPESRLYRAFNLERGRLWQLLAPKVWLRGFRAALLSRHGFSRIRGDGLQMPGAFVLRDGRVAASFEYHTAADRPDYCELADRAA